MTDTMDTYATRITKDPTRPYRLISRDEARARLDDADRERFDAACRDRDDQIRQTIIDYGRSQNIDPIPAGRHLAIATADQLDEKGWHPGAIELIIREIGAVATDLQQQFNTALEILAPER